MRSWRGPGPWPRPWEKGTSSPGGRWWKELEGGTFPPGVTTSPPVTDPARVQDCSGSCQGCAIRMAGSPKNQVRRLQLLQAAVRGSSPSSPEGPGARVVLKTRDWSLIRSQVFLRKEGGCGPMSCSACSGRAWPGGGRTRCHPSLGNPSPRPSPTEDKQTSKAGETW